ncbi:putative beta-lysine N-acetyltransferase [Candidatus Sumerlaeota bacterium]|nr:putative beta-lysine N-acetyltransferase [Candidatus Sumerlaeota bacterium]
MDRIERMGRSTIQHGPQSNRVYLMRLDPTDAPDIVEELDALARKKGYTKIFAKTPADAARPFTQQGYVAEARIPRFYNGARNAMFLAKFLDPDRAEPENQPVLDRVLSLAKAKACGSGANRTPPAGLDVVACGSGDAHEMGALYKEVFPTYPFPIHDPDYLRETMRTHIDYFGVREDGRLVALASSEMDKTGANVEMTDFATLPSRRGRGLAAWLLRVMEDAMRERGMQTAYTIARAVSPGMNITFAKMRYAFGGTLVNNTNISGSIESMNVWHKPLADPEWRSA